jgi:hypothetical protein
VAEGERPQVGLEGAQLGDARLGDVAGGDIYQGARADGLVELLRYQIDKDSQYRLLDLKAREIRQEELDKQMAAIMAELRIQRIFIIIGLVIIIFAATLR